MRCWSEIVDYRYAWVQFIARTNYIVIDSEVLRCHQRNFLDIRLDRIRALNVLGARTT